MGELIKSIMVFDDQATQEAKTSAAMAMIM